MSKYLSLAQLLPVNVKVVTARPLYSLFKKNGARWTRVSEQSYYWNTACYVFQDRLYAGWKSGVDYAVKRIDLNKDLKAAR